MSHRPYIKDDDSGNISDLAIDAETLQGYKPCVNIVTLEDNNSTKAGTWLAKTNKVSALVDGQLFLYKITVAGASTTTLNITGSEGALGAKTVYRTGTTKLTTQYAVGHYILLAYNSLNTCFRLVNDYDANSYAYVRQYQHGQNAAGATNLYPILTRYNLTNKNGKYDNAYARFYTDTYIDMTNGYLYAPKVYSGGSEVAVKTDIPAEVTETTVSGWGFTKNVGTVTSVRVQAGTGLSSSTSTAQTGTLNTTISIASGYKLLTNSEYSSLNVNSDWNATTGLAYIKNKPDILPIINYTGSSPVELYNLSKGRYINATSNNIALRNYAGGGMLPSVKWQPGEILTVMDNLHSWVLGTEYITGEYYIFSGKADSTFASSEYRGSSVADIANIPSSIGLGSESTPIYIEVVKNEQGMKQNTFKECKSYGGGTRITKINGYDTIGKTWDYLFAPTTAGEAGQILKSNGYGEPVWETVAIPSKTSELTNDSGFITGITSSDVTTALGYTPASENHTHSTTLATDSGTANVTMVPNETYKLSTGGTNVIFKTPSDAYKIVETLRKGSEADTAVGYYKIATINHVNWNFCDFCMLVKNSYAGVAYNTIFNCSCSDSNVDLRDFKLEIISGTDISNKLAYLYTYDSSNNLIKIEVFIHATRFEHPMCYIINARPGQQLIIPTQDEFNKATPDQPDGTTMTGYAKPDNRRLLNHDLGVMLEDTTTDNGWKMFHSTYMGYLLQSIRFNANSPDWGVGNYGAGIIFGGADTKGVISTGYGSPLIKFAGGNGSGPVWWIGLTGTSRTTYDLDRLKYAPTTAGTSGHSLKSNGSGAPRWANEAAVATVGSFSEGIKNNVSISLVITNTSKPLKKGVWRYSGKYGTFLIFAQNEITTQGTQRTAYICGYTTAISNNTSFTLVEV